MLEMEWIKHFHKVTKGTVMGGEWRLLIVDGHGSHITVEFVEFCLSVNIVAYCLPAPTSTSRCGIIFTTIENLWNVG